MMTLLALPAQATDMGIAAVVGGEAVSSYDVDNRVKFIIVTARLSGTPDVIERIRPQVVHSLIDERLQLQEASRNDVNIDDKEIDQAMAAIEQQRGMPPGTILEILDHNQLPHSTFTQQVKAQLAWGKLLRKKIRPQVHISDAEIKLAADKIAAAPPPSAAPEEKQTGTPRELKIAVIALPVDKPSRETEIKKLAEKLVGEVRRGASFEEVSRQFSSATANAGGKVEAFWVKPGQLEPNIAKILAGAKPGIITDPLRSNEGYTIIKVYDVRLNNSAPPKEAEIAPAAAPKEVELSIKEILLKLKPGAGNKEADTLLQIGEEVAKHPGSCEEKGVAGIQGVDNVDIEVNLRKEMQSQLPAAIKLIVGRLKPGEISTPFASSQGIVLYMLCGAAETDAKPIDRERVYQMLTQQKMELEAQKYIRNLRRETFIEIR